MFDATQSLMLARALSFATRAHVNQVDKAGVPYIAHPLRVAAKAIEHRCSAEHVIAAVLHDVVEDSPATLDDLRELGFSPVVVDAVEALTKRRGETYEEALGRAKANHIACAVKMFDALDNGRDERLRWITDAATRERLKAKYDGAFRFLTSAGEG